MSVEEIAQGTPLGYGHGIYRVERDEVAVNATMDSLNIFLNFIHEHLHRLFPNMNHAGIRLLTALVDCRTRKPGGETCNLLEELEERERP